jgi:hypothetical protein
MYRSPSRPLQRSQSVALSPTASARRVNTLSTTDNWAGSNRTSPCCVARGLPLPDSSNVSRSDWRPTLPSLPSLTLSHNNAVPRGRSTFSEYALESSRSGAQTYPHLSGSQFDPPIPSYHPALSYGYQQPRGQSYSGPSTYPLTHDRSPFSNNHQNIYPGSGFPYGLERDEGNDSKQRKRRGNLPKETTDKLRAWFVAHLQHPYPTEDEKQELMRKTGLQMSKFPYDYSPFFPQLIFCGLLNAENQFPTGFRVTEANLNRSNLQLVHQRTSTAAASNDQQRTR